MRLEGFQAYFMVPCRISTRSADALTAYIDRINHPSQLIRQAFLMPSSVRLFTDANGQTTGS